MTIQLKNQLLNIQNGRNFRELGGYRTISGKRIKRHKLIRSGHLGNLSERDLEFLSSYSVKYDIDLRTNFEKNNDPDLVPSSAKYVEAPVFDEDLTNSTVSVSEMARQAGDDPNWGYSRMLWAYENMVTGKNSRIAYKKLFELLLANDQDNSAVLFHCTAGKDRTGFGAMLILSALGVPLKTIKEDYLLTNQAIKPFINNMMANEKAKGASDTLLHSLHDLQTVQIDYLNSAIKLINSNYGSINAFLQHELGLRTQDLLTLRQIYLED